MKNKKIITQMLDTKGSSRRSFMAGASALGLSMAAGASLWSSSAFSAAPSKGGHFRVGLNGASASDTLFGPLVQDMFTISLAFALRDNLTEMGADNSLQPALASSWESSPDAKVWRFKLRQGVEFSNGKSVSPEDVIASLNAHRGEDTKSGAKGLLLDVKHLTAEGADTVVIELNSGNADFPYSLSDYHLNIVPFTNGQLDWSGVGTGLYTLESFEPGVRATLKRNPNAWQTGYGHFDTVEMIAINDTNARQNALITGEVDAINRIDLKTVNLLKRRPGLRVIDVPGRMHYTMPMHVDHADFKDVNVRMALMHAIDRQEFVDKILLGYGQVGNDNPIGPAFRYHAADIPQRAYDADKAKFYMKKAGLSRIDVKYNVSDAAYSGAVDGGILFKESAAKAGINIDVVRRPNDGYWSDVWLKEPFCACYWGPRPVEDMVLSAGYLSDAKWNDTHFKSEKLDQLILSARSELNESLRAEMYRDIQLIISNEGGQLVPAFANLMCAISDNIGTSDQIGGSWDMDGGYFIKRWWKA